MVSDKEGKTDQYLIRRRRKRCLCAADKHIKLCHPSTDYKASMRRTTEILGFDKPNPYF